MSKQPRYYGMDNERVWPHWDCPACDALNPGVEQCDPRLVPRYGPVYCDECGGELIYDFEATGEVGWCPAFLEDSDAVS